MTTRCRTLIVVLITLLNTACTERTETPAASGATPLSIQLDWVPEPEFGGYYAAREQGVFSAAGLEVDLRPGSPGVPVLQLVEAGKADFGITSGDSLLIARARGADVIALFAVYQTFAQGIMVHAERGLHSLEDVFASGTLAIEPGTPVLKVLERRYGLGKIKVVPYNNTLAPFLHDPSFAQQCYVTAEPISARRAGARPQVFALSETGYNPYGGVLFTRRTTLANHPEQVAALINGLRDGWRRYLNDPTATNAVMHHLNPAMDTDTFAEAARIQTPLIDTGGTLGVMDAERWRALAEQLREIGQLKSTDIEGAFVNP